MQSEDMKIDFVVLWVDGADPVWQEKYSHYNALYKPERYRDWDLFRYWFRGVEQYAPWVNKIHLITDGQCPEWLNVNHPKLNLVDHKDYIPSEYLPTFNSNVIELNLHRLKGLSEHFVLFNDDLYIIDHIKYTRFFTKDLSKVKDRAVLDTYHHLNSYSSTLCNSIAILNSHFNKNKVVKNNISNWINFKYPIKLLCKTFALLPWSYFTGLNTHHFPQPYFKSTFETVWDIENERLNEACMNKLRSHNDLSHNLMCFWQLVASKFSPASLSDSKFFSLGLDDIDHICNVVSKQKKSIAIINDTEFVSDFETYKRQLTNSFNTILPNKSNFEL